MRNWLILNTMKLGYPGQHAKRLSIYVEIDNKAVMSIICLHYNFLHSNPVDSYAHHAEA